MEEYGGSSGTVCEPCTEPEESVEQWALEDAVEIKQQPPDPRDPFVEAYGPWPREAVLEQIDRESRLLFEGVQRFQQQYYEAVKEGEAGETLAGRWLISQCIPKVSNQLEAAIKDVVENSARKRSRAGVLVSPLKPEVLAFITIRALVDATVADTPERTKVGKRN